MGSKNFMSTVDCNDFHSVQGSLGGIAFSNIVGTC